MSYVVVDGIDPLLYARIKRLADAHGESMADTVLLLVDEALQAREGEDVAQPQAPAAPAPPQPPPPPLSAADGDALKRAILALEQVPDDPGFGLIGRDPD